MQRFETTYFNLLAAFKDEIKHFELKDEVVSIQGKERSMKNPITKEYFKDYSELIELEVDEILNTTAGYRTSHIIIRGKNVFKLLYFELTNYIIEISKNDSIERQEVINKAYRKLLDNYNTILSTYNKIFIRTVKFIEKSDIEDKQFYVDFLRAQLSTYEVLLNYNASISAQNIRQLDYPDILKKYRFYRYIPRELLIKKEDLSFYQQYLKP